MKANSVMANIVGPGKRAFLAAMAVTFFAGCAAKNGAVIDGPLANDITCPEAMRYEQTAREDLITASAGISDPKIDKLANFGGENLSVTAARNKLVVAENVRNNVCSKPTTLAALRPGS